MLMAPNYVTGPLYFKTVRPKTADQDAIGHRRKLVSYGWPAIVFEVLRLC